MFGFLLMEDNFPVVKKGGFLDATCSNYMSISSSCSYFMEDFDDRSTLFDNGDIVHVQLLVQTFNLFCNRHQQHSFCVSRHQQHGFDLFRHRKHDFQFVPTAASTRQFLVTLKGLQWAFVNTTTLSETVLDILNKCTQMRNPCLGLCCEEDGLQI